MRNLFQRLSIIIVQYINIIICNEAISKSSDLYDTDLNEFSIQDYCENLDTEKSCKLKSFNHTQDFTFVLSAIVNNTEWNEYKIEGEDIQINCIENCTNIQFIYSVNNTETTDKIINVNFHNVTIKSKSIVFDFGMDAMSNMTLENLSQQDVSNTVINGAGTYTGVIKNFETLVDYAGSSNLGYGKAYLEPDLIKSGYQNFVNDPNYYGSGCPVESDDVVGPTYDWLKGGGLIYINLKNLIFKDKGSKIKANGYLSNDIIDHGIFIKYCGGFFFNHAGTGGTIFIISDIEFRQKFEDEQILAEGGKFIVNIQALESLITGSGGRVYIHTLNQEVGQKKLKEIGWSVKASSDLAGSELHRFRKASGTIQIIADKDKLNQIIIKSVSIITPLLTSEIYEDVISSNQKMFLDSINKPKFSKGQDGINPPIIADYSFTYLSDRGESRSYILEGNIVLSLMKCLQKIGYNTLNITALESAYQSDILYDENELKPSQKIIPCKNSIIVKEKIELKDTRFWLFVNQSVLKNDNRNFCISANDIEIIRTEINFSQHMKLQITTKTFTAKENSLFTNLYKFYGYIKDYNNQKARGSLSIRSDNLIQLGLPNTADRQFKVYVSKQIYYSTNDSVIIELASFKTFKGMTMSGYDIKNFEIKTEEYVNGYLLKSQPDDSRSKNLDSLFDLFLHDEPESNIYIRGGIYIIAKNKITFKKSEYSKNSIQGGYIFLLANEISVGEDFGIITSGRGNSSRYQNDLKFRHNKVCGLTGGSGSTIGTFGSQIPYFHCKSLGNYQNDLTDLEQYRNYATPGMGGEMELYPDNKNYCLGGGVINMAARNITSTGGLFQSNGGGSVNFKIFNCAGGGGGSIKITAYYLNIGAFTKFEALGGTSNEQNGAGSGGKIIIRSLDKALGFNATDETKENIMNNIRKNFVNGELKNYNSQKQYHLNQYNLNYERPKLYDGSAINLGFCNLGEYGPLCKKCPENYFNPTIDHDECIKCPCKTQSNASDENDTEMFGIERCKCIRPYNNFTQSGIICMVIGIFIIICIIQYGIIHKFGSPADDSEHFKQKVKDIPYSVQKLRIEGQNTYYSPLSMPDYLDIDAKLIDELYYLKFKEKFDKIYEWSYSEIFSLFIMRYLSYCPTYMSLIRFYRYKKLCRIIKLVENQKEYNLFKNYNHVLKWCVSNNCSVVFIEIVENEQLPKFDWHFKFPLKFPIIGTGSFNHPLKLEMTDPNIIKMFDYLKDYIKDTEDHYDELNIPHYIKKTILRSNVFKHIVDYYFCKLMGLLKMITKNLPIGVFLQNFRMLHEFIDTGNHCIFNKERFGMQIKLNISRYIYVKGEKIKRSKEIDLIYHDEEDIERKGLLLYNLFSNKKKNVEMNLEFEILKIKMQKRIYKKSTINEKTHPEIDNIENFQAKSTKQSIKMTFKNLFKRKEKPKKLTLLIEKSSFQPSKSNFRSVCNLGETKSSFVGDFMFNQDENNLAQEYQSSDIDLTSHIGQTILEIKNDPLISPRHLLESIATENNNFKHIELEEENDDAPSSEHIMAELKRDSIDTELLYNNLEINDSKSTNKSATYTMKQIRERYVNKLYEQNKEKQIEPIDYNNIYYEYIDIIQYGTFYKIQIGKYISWFCHSHIISDFYMKYFDQIIFMQLLIESLLIIAPTYIFLLSDNGPPILLIIDNLIGFPFMYCVSVILGYLTVLTKNATSTGRIYCTSNYLAIINILLFQIVYGFGVLFYDEIQKQVIIKRTYLWVVLSKQLIKILQSICSCYLVSFLQNKKTIKFLVMQNQKSQ